MILYSAITTIEPERDVLRCLPESIDIKKKLLSFQGSFGIGAYDNGTFVGSLWFYLMIDGELGNPYVPDWSGLKLGSAGYHQLLSKPKRPITPSCVSIASM
jgi:hypothetical protein